MLLIKTHLSQCSERFGGNLGDIWRPLEVHLRLPLNRWKSPPPGIQRVDDHDDRRSPSWHDPIPQSCNQTRCQESAWCTPRHRAMPLTAMPGGKRRGPQEGRAPQRGGGVCLFYCMTQLYKKQSHNRPTGKPAVITGTKPSVKILTIQTSGPHETHTYAHTQEVRDFFHHLILQSAKLYFVFVLNKRSVIVINDLQT